jgi:hypothetical protein
MTDEERRDLKSSLLHRLRTETPLTPEEGDEAFDQHLLLAARIHRAARLNQTGDDEGRGWQQFFVDYFPSGRNDPDDAWLLWKKWRVGLLKDYTPLEGVAMAHGKPDLHWQRDSQGALAINLESMWDDFEHAVGRFIDALGSDDDRAAVVLERWKQRTWTVRPFSLLPQMIGAKDGPRVFNMLPGPGVTARAAQSVTANGPQAAGSA